MNQVFLLWCLIPPPCLGCRRDLGSSAATQGTAGPRVWPWEVVADMKPLGVRLLVEGYRAGLSC